MPLRTPLHRALALLLIATCAPAEEVFRDLALEGGFRLSNVTTAHEPLELGAILATSGAADPAWRLAQWGTRFNLLPAPDRIGPAGARIRENEGKAVTIHPGGLSGKGVTLEVRGGAEYGGKLREKGQLWPHLLVEQRMPDGLRLADKGRMPFTLAFRVDHARPATAETLDPSLHTTQVTAYWTMNNHNPDSADYRDMIWFGIPLFDARQDIPKGHQAVDAGAPGATGKFICTLPGDRFYDAPTGNGAWHRIEADLVPLVKEALAASQAHGFLKDTTFEDLHATSFNLGWETPGPYDCAITLKGLSLQAV
ncbi:MAG: hypothetical protein KF886_17150 [Candidatus Hydrogenedentes bacterium]|nr:hypothetical protein [Candidatus Hydrogenedentota bacterium]